MTEQPDLKARVEELRRVAEAALEASEDNGHCGEGTMEYRARRERRIATEQAHIATFDPLTVLALLSSITDLEAERDEALKLLLTRYVSGDLVRIVTHALADIARSSETICRLRGETDADEDLKRFVHYVDHTMNMSSGAVSEIIDFAQGQMARAQAAESRLALADAALRWIAGEPKDGGETCWDGTQWRSMREVARDAIAYAENTSSKDLTTGEDDA